MRCAYCGRDNTKTIDSRPHGLHEKRWKRRYECLDCGKRYNTFEEYASVIGTKCKVCGGHAVKRYGRFCYKDFKEYDRKRHVFYRKGIKLK